MDNNANDAIYTIQQAAELSGLPSSTLRYYESVGLISPPVRADNGHRRYSQDDLSKISTIACLNATGLSIESMHEYLENASRQDATAEIELLRDHVAALEYQQRVTQLLLRYVGLKIAFWQAVSGGNTAEIDAAAARAHDAAMALKRFLEGEQ